MRLFRAFAAVALVAVALAGCTLNIWWSADPADLTVYNNYVDRYGWPQSITAVYISPASSTTWGRNQIDRPIGAGGSRTISAIPPGWYDLKAVAADGTEWTRFGDNRVFFADGQSYSWDLR